MTREEIDNAVKEIREHCRNSICSSCEALTIFGCVFVCGEPNERPTIEEAEKEMLKRRCRKGYERFK